MKKGAIFDMDGLLFDTERLYCDCWVAMADRFGQVHNPDFISAVGGTNGAHMLEVIHEYYPAVDAQAFMDGCMARMETLLQTQGVPEKSGMREILTFFREKGVKLALASSTGKKRILENLRFAGVQDYFDAVVSGQEVAKGKPKPDIFLLAAERIGCTPSDCYVFEDGINGVQAGIAAGCATVMIPDLIEPPKSLRPQCAAICGSLQEAMRLIEKGEL